jgi:molybdopterin synthase catalytic subunit
LFAILADRAGTRELELELADGARVADALAAMGQLAGELTLVMAVNRDYADPSTPLAPGDELALIPPVSGGSPDGPVHARIREEALVVDELIARVSDPRAGAVVTFLGVTREVERLHYEAYVEMAEPMLGEIARRALAAHRLCRVAVEHRVGAVGLSEPSVAVAVSAAHREEAFAGARAIIDEVKATTPIWKQEIEGQTARWVPGTTPR